MQIIAGLHHFESKFKASVATIGNFDGVHRGHQSIIKQVIGMAEQVGAPAMLITFEPQPQEYFAKQHAPPRLTRFREKSALIRAHGIDALLCMRFNEELANMQAEDFIKTLLVDKLAIRDLIVGNDFRFGYQRQGDIDLLLAAGERFGFGVHRIEGCYSEQQRISSTLIRDMLQHADFDGARKMLGHPYCICGRVVHGEKNGRKLGVPTANINLHRHASVLHGIYVVQLKGIGDAIHNGVASVGTKPTFDGEKMLLEVHLFDFEKTIYGHYVEIEFLHKLRDEQKFVSVDALIVQMQEDIADAKTWFKGNGVNE